MLERFDPAVTLAEHHVRAKDVARRLSIGYTTALRLIKAHPKCKYLPSQTRNGRTRRTPMLPESALREIYTQRMKL